ncbi:MAG TPA: tetratricopeptide repeat protein [Thermoanaerobaculia bacterium]|jgi:tetratricopeptide (TPR) repeat protein|nr:tetratricopeptide repeat protein [Thermoanaerobaculia bacterium]
MVSRKLKTLLLLAALVLAAGIPAYGQVWAGRGRLQGTVTDESGKPVQGAKITLRKGTERVDPKTDGPPPLTTDKNGKWSTLGLAQGAWGILIEKEGFMLSEGQIQVNEFGPAKPINVALKVIPKEVLQKAEQESAAGQAKAAIERGNALLNEGKFAEARAAYQEGMGKLEDKSLHPAILRAIADTYYKENKSDQAIDTLKQALALAPEDADTLRLITTLLVAAGREAEAQQYMAKLPQGATLDPNTILNLGIKAFNEGKMDQALAQFDRVVKENPNLADAYYYRALTYLNQDKKAQAKADLEKLLEVDPNNKYAKDAREMLKDLK